MKWVIDYYNQSVNNNIESLHKTIQAKFEAILDKIEEYGPNLGLPFTRAMSNGLFEIRAKGHAGIARGLFCIMSNKRIVILHVFVKKTDAIPKKELDLAIKRMKEVIKNGI